MKTDALLLIGAGGLAYAMYKSAKGEGDQIFDFTDSLDPAKRAQEVDVLARTIWGEARGEAARGMQAVANVVVNRAKSPGWWGRDIVSVCLANQQFSAWNRNDPNYNKVISVTVADSSFRTALDIAAKAVAGVLADITGGATHYHTKAVNPYWAPSLRLIGEIGAHKFYA